MGMSHNVGAYRKASQTGIHPLAVQHEHQRARGKARLADSVRGRSVAGAGFAQVHAL